MLNPLAFTENVIGNFLKYQMTAYPFQDERLNRQMRGLLQLDHARQSPLLQGPFVSLSQSFTEGCAISSLTKEGILHPHLNSIAPFPTLYSHQEKAIRAVEGMHTTLISTGTGSGKSECFLYPAISQALRLRDKDAPSGISSVIVYPMNALAEDQLDRLRGLLAGTGISFGIYVGKTPDTEQEVAGFRMPAGSSKADYERKVQEFRKEKRPDTIHPCEEVCSRQMMRTDGQQPRILLTNVKQLELLLTRGVDAEMFYNATLDYLVFDEAHTFTGIIGAESACLVRRLKAFCGAAGHTICIATSATIVDKANPNAARDFAARFFGDKSENVVCVTEEYQRDSWKPSGVMPKAPADANALLKSCLEEVENTGNDFAIGRIYDLLCQRSLPPGDWHEMVYDAIQDNPLAALIAEELRTPHSLADLAACLSQKAARDVSEAELLCYLILGAAAVRDGRAIYRPVVHAFVRGIPGAVVTFPLGQDEPKLWLSGEDEKMASEGKEEYWPLRVFTCTTCGQHYFIHYVKDFDFSGKIPSGGNATEIGNSYWEKLDPENGGERVILLDKILYMEEDEEPDSPRTANVWFCRHCGTLHSENQARCSHCGSASPLVKLYAVKLNEDGYLSSCLSCQTHRTGRNRKEPIREVRAVHVADVHVLAQEIIQHEDRKRLLIFADSRQDAAFQAGWMKDHARRYRIISLIDETLGKTPDVRVGDLIQDLCEVFDRDENLSRALLPEVWNWAPKSDPRHHQMECKKYLTIQVIRELSLGTRIPVGLESWGRLQIHYDGLSSSTLEIQQIARHFALSPDDVLLCIEGMLDRLRWNRIVLERNYQLNSKAYMEGDDLYQRGYLTSPVYKHPMAVKFELDSKDDKRFIQVFWQGRECALMNLVRKVGVDSHNMKDFLQDVWNLLTGKQILVPVQLVGSKGHPISGTTGGYQIDSDRIILNTNTGFYQCDHCRRKTSRKTPEMKCLAWRCSGKLEYVHEQHDNYNLHVIEERYSLMRPEEHTAMVPQAKRDMIENAFKSPKDNQINTLVCTPTLELGVDIGALDCTLMRNVPPLPANYWQRVGRAGRRHRMAVNLTYCRSVSYDKAYYENPLKMLGGPVEPPAFNLKNGVMVAKHIHALILTTTNQLIHDDSLPQAERDEIRSVRDEMFPSQVSRYLFDANSHLRTKPLDFTPFGRVLEKHFDRYLAATLAVFHVSWPNEDAEVVGEKKLKRLIQETSGELDIVAKRLFRRLQWAHQEIQRLEHKKRATGTFDHPEDEAHYRRCDALIKKYKGIQSWKKRKNNTPEDDISTYGILAAEGFLPGYGLDTGSVRATGEMPFTAGGGTLELPRPLSMALREYVPGNLIYANGQKFVPRHYMLITGEQYQEQPVMAFTRNNEAMVELSPGASPASLGMEVLKTIPICDVELAHQLQISDEEENRFQMPVMVFAVDKEQHNGGTEYGWGNCTLQYRRNTKFRMANLGTPGATGGSCGYLVCTVCGQSISPMSSNEALKKFKEGHKERCGHEPQQLGFYADISADCLKMPGCKDRTVAYSMMEALRMGAAHVLDMHLEDLQVMVIGHIETEAVDAYLWDPMPGGSGLIQQILADFDLVSSEALRLLESCSGACEKACVNCMQNFRNIFYHKSLDRHIAIGMLQGGQGTLRLKHHIPPTRTTGNNETEGSGSPVNQPEARLKRMLDKAGLTEGIWQHQIQFKKTIERLGFKTTTPDVFYPALEEDEDEKGLCLYLDGMSRDIHGNAEAQAKDMAIRTQLRNEGYIIVELTVQELDDSAAVAAAFRKIAKFAFGPQKAKEIKENTAWFGG